MPTPAHTPEAESGGPAEDPFPSRAFAAIALIPGWRLVEPPLDAAISLPHLAICLGGVLLAALGAFAAASLLGYSRTLLAAEIAEELADEAADVRDQLHAEVARYDTEYLAVAFAFTVAGWITALWALRLAVAPDHQGAAMVALGAVMLLGTGSLPAAVTKERAERALLAVRPAIRGGWLLLRWPLVLPLMQLTRLSLWLLRVKARPANTAEVHKQVMAAVADSAEDTLQGEERTWIGNIIGLKDLQVSTIMTPRPDIVAFAEDTPLSQAVEKALEHGFSRYPIYRERVDDVIGILYIKDTLRVLQGDTQAIATASVKSMMRDTLFVPETMGAAQLLRMFQAGNQHMAIVLDEYGTTAGIVSVEDVLEQIVGEIADEYDEEPGSDQDGGPVTVVEQGRVVEVPARASVEDVNHLLGSALPDDGDWETVAGLVITRSNRIPRQGEHVVVDGVEFHVLAADERRLVRLRATMLEPHAAEEAG